MLIYQNTNWFKLMLPRRIVDTFENEFKTLFMKILCAKDYINICNAVRDTFLTIRLYKTVYDKYLKDDNEVFFTPNEKEKLIEKHINRINFSFINLKDILKEVNELNFLDKGKRVVYAIAALIRQVSDFIILFPKEDDRFFKSLIQKISYIWEGYRDKFAIYLKYKKE